MRIALSFPGCHRRGGVERIVLECANYLQTRGHEIHLLATEWDAPELTAGIQCHKVPAGQWSWKRIADFARNSRKVLASLPQAPDVTAAFGVEAPPGGVVWVQSVHKAWMEVSQSHRSLKGRLKQRLNPFHAAANRLEARCFGGREYRRLIALTDTVKSDLMRLYNVPAADISVLPNGYSPTEFNLQGREATRRRVRQRLGIREEHKLVLFVANELERKGFRTLLRAMAAGDSSEQLVAVGRFSPADCQPEITALGMQNRVHFPGSAANVAEFYAAADVFALPTQYEPWGLVIVEALACGLPVLTSQLAGAAVAVRQGQTGELLDCPTDERETSAKLRRLLDGQHADARTISESVQEWAWPRILERYENILLECAATRPGAFALAQPPARTI